MKGFYGWRIVAACVVLATVAWSLGVFGMGVYVYALSSAGGFSLTTVSTAITTAFMVGASLMVMVGRLVARYGPKPVVGTGIVAMSLAVVGMAHCVEAWQLYMCFVLHGIGMACISTNTIGTTLAPWFERYQGKAMSTAMLGASVGGMIGTPLLMFGIRHFGYELTAALAGMTAFILVMPLVVLVLKARPQDIGEAPDGIHETGTVAPRPTKVWTLSKAWKTRNFRSHVFAFACAFLVQVGFLSHHVPIAVPVLGPGGAAAAVTSAAVAAFLGRVLLARYADRVDVRKLGAWVLIVATMALTGMALVPGPSALMVTSVVYGLTVGNVTTLAPLIMRREFGAASFGVVFGVAATVHQLSMSMGPSFFGILRDVSGSYVPALLLGGALNIIAAATLVYGRGHRGDMDDTQR